MSFLILIFSVFSFEISRAEPGYYWSPKKIMEISENEVVADGKKVAPLKCTVLDKTKIGKLTLGADSFSVSCKAGYLGGIYIDETLLAQRETDAGDSWDTHSLFFFDDKSKAWIWSTITYSTSDLSVNCDGQSADVLKQQGWSDESIKGCKSGKIQCRKIEKFKKWDDQRKTNSDYAFNGPIPKRKLRPFPRYLDNCK